MKDKTWMSLAALTLVTALGLFVTGKAQESKDAYPNDVDHIHGLYVAATVTVWIGWVFCLGWCVTIHRIKPSGEDPISGVRRRGGLFS